MNRHKIVKNRMIVFGMILILALASAGCAGALSDGKTVSTEKIELNAFEKELLGQWAFIHDTKTVAAEFFEDKTAVYEGKTYSYTADDTYICFTDKEAEAMKLRYQKKGEGQIFLYIQSTYKLQNGKQDGIIGYWKSKENWTFEFTDKGTFLEDGVMTGHYSVNEKDGTIKLAYEKELEDSDLYYKLSDDGLFIEYPWLMVKISA